MRYDSIASTFTFFGINAQSQLIIDKGHFFTDNEVAELETKMQSLKKETSVETLIYTTIAHTAYRN